MAEFEAVSRFREELRSNNLFRLSVIVFIVHLIVFFFVELRSLKSSSFMAAFTSTIMLASMILIIGILTVVPNFSLYVGRTLISSSVLIFLAKIIELLAGKSGIFSMVEILIGFTSLMYGMELIKRFKPIVQQQIQRAQAQNQVRKQ